MGLNANYPPKANQVSSITTCRVFSRLKLSCVYNICECILQNREQLFVFWHTILLAGQIIVTDQFCELVFAILIISIVQLYSMQLSIKFNYVKDKQFIQLYNF